jgi:hypothetical protein
MIQGQGEQRVEAEETKKKEKRGKTEKQDLSRRGTWRWHNAMK